MNARTVCLLALALCLAAFNAFAADPPPEFEQLTGFPMSPAEGAFAISADALGDGRYVLYDGNAVWVEDAVFAGTFTSIASGYPGDPAFISTAPDGHTVLLGGGFTDPGLWLIDTDAPVDNADPVTTFETHFWADFIDADRIIVDYAVVTNPDTFETAASLAIIDLSVDPPLRRDVVGGPRGASGALTVDHDRDVVYATDGLTGETRSFSIPALLNAFDTETPLAWTDGTLIGTYNSHGVFGVSRQGNLVIGGSDPDTFEGTVQFVDAETGMISGEVDPTGNQFTFYSGAYNRVTGRVLLVGADFPGPVMTGFESTESWERLPVSIGEPGAGVYYFFAIWAFIIRRILSQLFGLGG